MLSLALLLSLVPANAAAKAGAQTSADDVICVRKFTTYAGQSYTVYLTTADAKEAERQGIMLLPRFEARVAQPPGAAPASPRYASLHVYVSPDKAAALVEAFAFLGVARSRAYAQNFFPSDGACIPSLLATAEAEKVKHAADLARMPAASFFLDDTISGLRVMNQILKRAQTLAEITLVISGPAPSPPPRDLKMFPRDYLDHPFHVPEAAWSHYLRLGVPDVAVALRRADEIFSREGILRRSTTAGDEQWPFPYHYRRATYRMSRSAALAVEPQLEALGHLTKSDSGGGEVPYQLRELEWRIGLLKKIAASGLSAAPDFDVEVARAPALLADLKRERETYESSQRLADFTIDFYAEGPR